MMNIHRRLFAGRASVLGIFLAGFILTAIACSSDPDPTATGVAPVATKLTAVASPEKPAIDKTTKIGTLFDVTGDLGVYGPPSLLAVDLAVELINEAGGINGGVLEAVHRDSATSEQIAIDAASALVNVDGVSGIIGSVSSGVSIAVAESVTIPSDIVLVSPASSSPAISTLDDNDLVFRTYPSDALQGVVLASLVTELGYRNVATTYINNAYGEGLTTVFTENFERMGGAVSAQVGHESGQASYVSELRKASEGGAETLIVMAYPESARVLIRESLEGDFFSKYLFSDGLMSQELFDALNSDVLDGSYGTIAGSSSTSNREAFLDLYSSRMSGNPKEPFISESFDATVILALAIEKTDSVDGNDLKIAMREVANAPGEKVGPGDIARALELIRNGQDVDYVGAAGDHDFDENGDVLNTTEIWKVTEGKIESTGIFVNSGDAIDLSLAAVPAPARETVKIGTLLDVTGDLGVYGPPMRTAVDLAVELVNEAGGVNSSHVEAVHRDSATSEQVATDAASALVNVEGVNAIVGSLSSGVTLAVAESVTIPGGAVLVSPASTSPALSSLDDNDLLFRTAVSDALQGVVLASLATELGHRNVATLYINNAYGEGLTGVFTENFERIGGTVSAQVGHESGQATYLSELRKASDGDADTLVAIAYPESAGVFIREAVEGDFFQNYLFVDGTKSQEMFDSLGNEELNGSYGTAPGAPAGSKPREAFVDLYSTRTDGNPESPFISEAFDAAVILLLAIEKSDSTAGDGVKTAMRDVANGPGEKVGPGDIARALELIRNGQEVDYVGAAGDQDFDENGDVLNTIEIWELKEGEIVSTGVFAKPGGKIDLVAATQAQTDTQPASSASSVFNIGSGSRGLFKVDETLRGLDIVVALETDVISGIIDLNAGTVSVEIDLHSLQSDQSRRDRYVRERLFASQSIATVAFDALGDIPESFFTSGEELSTRLTATVNVNGADAQLPFDITARLDNGTDLVVLGTADFVWSDFGMDAPASNFYTVEDDVRVEILLEATLAQ